MRTEMPRDESRMLGFVISTVTGEAHRERFHVVRCAHGHRRHQAGVDSAAEENSYRHVCNQLLTYGVLQQLLKLLEQGGLRGATRRGGARWWGQLPVAPATRHPAFQIEQQGVCRGQLVDALEDRALAAHEALPEVVIERLPVDAPRQRGVGQKTL